MDLNDVLTSAGTGIGQGMAASFSLLAGVTVFGIPVSYMTNRFIYHSKGLRFLLTIVGAILSIPLLLGMIIYQLVTWGNGIAKVHYFGYIPLLTKGSEQPAKSGPGEMGWFLPLLTPIWEFVCDTLLAGFIDHRDTIEDQSAYASSMDTILLPLAQKGQGVNEQVVLKALEAAQQATTSDALILEHEQMELLKTPISVRSD